MFSHHEHPLPILCRRCPALITPKVTERELRQETERRRLDHLLQDTRAELKTAVAAAAAATAAEGEAAARAQRARAAQEMADECAATADERADKLEAECAELREVAGRLGAQFGEACEREGMLRGLLKKAEEGRVAAEAAGEKARKKVVCERSELVEARRRVDEGEADRRRLVEQVRGRRRRGSSGWTIVPSFRDWRG